MLHKASIQCPRCRSVLFEALLESETDERPDPQARRRADAARASHQAKRDELYRGQHFTIVEEVHLERGDHFRTPLGNKGRNGFVLRNDVTGERHTVGGDLLDLIAREYGAVDLPPRERKAPPEGAVG